MRYRREQNHHDTSEKPDIDLYVEQEAIPVKTASQWTLGSNMAITGGKLVLTASADAEVASRRIPGLLEGHLYKVTDTVDSIDAGELDVVIGGVAVGSLAAVQTYTWYVRPTGGNLMTITVDNAVSVITSTVSILRFEALEGIDPDRLVI